MSNNAVGMDIRLPMGLMFTILGAIITLYGACGLYLGSDTPGSPSVETNVWWGLVMGQFGIIMLITSRRAADTAAASEARAVGESAQA